MNIYVYELERVAASAEIEWLHAGHLRADCRISSIPSMILALY
jgi:hypothetical protein